MKLLSKPWRREKRQNEFERWLTAQLNDLESGTEIEPPWVTYAGQEPWWGGWRQGFSEGWYLQVWRPFWKRLSEEEQLAYVNKWETPPEWREYLLDPDRWFGQSKNGV